MRPTRSGSQKATHFKSQKATELKSEILWCPSARGTSERSGWRYCCVQGFAPSADFRWPLKQSDSGCLRLVLLEMQYHCKFSSKSGMYFWVPKRACLKEVRSTPDNSNEDREICLFCLPVKRPVGVGFSESEAHSTIPSSFLHRFHSFWDRRFQQRKIGFMAHTCDCYCIDYMHRPHQGTIFGD